MKIIGLMGFAGAGKNTIADTLGFPQAAFADELKSDLAPVLNKLGLVVTQREDKIKAREVLVAYGKLARALDPDYWIKRLEARYAHLHDTSITLVITDVRYLNECQYILAQGGTLVYISRPGVFAANEEEAEKYSEIIEAKMKGVIDFKTVENYTTPQEAATDVQEACGLNLPRKTIPQKSYAGEWVAKTAFIKGGWNGKTVEAYVIHANEGQYHVRFTDGTTDDRCEDWVYVHLTEMIDEGILVSLWGQSNFEPSVGHAAETARRFNANEPYWIADDGWDTAPASKSAIFDDDYDAPPAVEAEVIEANLDAEAAVLGHPAWQKLQQYPAGFDPDLIEEVPHYINATGYTDIARFRRRDHVLLKALKWLLN